ncbi:hypothetical protein WJX73_005525 [Symbiochloris irregularis]|uniref:Thioredoxin domain-containing protein n=1 Tax=Symbiochloris irregularis TaxID=706552 RepID=A0AAW1NWM0_9CHLO
MAYRKGLSQYGRPALRWLTAGGEGVTTSGCVESTQMPALRAPGGQSVLIKPFHTARTSQAQSTGSATAEQLKDAGAKASGTAGQAFESAKKAPAAMYASVGGALGAAGGLYYLLFGGATGAEVAGEPPAGLGAAHIGEYSVTTHAGAKFNETELKDDFAVVYFGSTTDRECVTELEKLAEVVYQSDRKTNMHYLNPVFVTVDAETDSEEKMRNVVDLFNTNHNRKNVRLVGLTGPDTVKLHQAAIEYSHKDGPEADQPDHRIYLVNPEGEFVKAYSADVSPAEMSEDLQNLIIKYKVNNASWHAPKKVARRHA